MNALTGTETTATEATLHGIADRLSLAELSGRPIAPLSEGRPALTVADAYAIQAINVGRHPRTPFLGLAAPLFGVAGGFNVVGFDSASLWLEHVTGGLRRQQLAARSLGWLPPSALASTIAVVGLVAWTGQWRMLPALLLAAAGTVAIGLAIGLVVSVMGPLPVEDGQNPFAWRGANGANLVVGLATFVGLVAMVAFAAPYVVPMLVWFDSPWITLVGLAGALWGWAWWWVALRLAARRIEGRTPELIARLSPRAVS